MKKIIVGFFLLMPVFVFAQTAPTLDSSDIVFNGEFLKYHRASNAGSASHTLTGANVTWDFSQLQSAANYTDTFVGVSAAPLTYSLFFFFSSSTCSPEKNPSSIAGTTLQDVWNFYKKSPTKFQQPGFAGSIQGIPTPIMYSSADVLYRFPLQFGNVDSCKYTYTLGGAGLGFGITEARNRHNMVDGWGTLITPSDTFAKVLRVHSLINVKDSIALDSVNLNFNVINSIQHEYKYLAKGYDWPIVTIRTTEFFGFETTTGVYYRDTVHHHAAANPDGLLSLTTPVLQTAPNPANNEIRVFANVKIAKVNCYKLDGQQVRIPAIINNQSATLIIESLPAGTYVLEVITNSAEQQSARFIKQ